MTGHKPLFISFEGLDGCGKSLQSHRLYQHMQDSGIPAVLLHEPGSTPLGEEIGRLLKWSDGIRVSPLAELLLFNASRAQLVKEIILPSLENGLSVIIDRFTDSTLVYQGYGRGLPLELVREVNEIAHQGAVPDLSVLLDVPVEVSAGRIAPARDRFESENPGFYQKIRNGYLEVAENEPERWLVVDGTLNADIISAIIQEHFKLLIQVSGE
ncbi:MAG: dTMP kinase [Dehalococcoidaceae bacterium]|nr:dTMP kinase [Dehalococcoidaceae bacterium]